MYKFLSGIKIIFWEKNAFVYNVRYSFTFRCGETFNNQPGTDNLKQQLFHSIFLQFSSRASYNKKENL